MVILSSVEIMTVRSIVYLFVQCVALYGLSEADPLAGKNVWPTKEGEFPFFVALSYSSDVTKKDDYYCGGTLISKRHVLTLKHCIDGEDHNLMIVVNAASQQARTAHKIKSWITYDDWLIDQNTIAGTKNNDIAIITLLDEVGEVVKPAIISKWKQKQVFGNKVMAVGWGHSDKVNRVLSDTFMKAYMNVMDSAKISRHMDGSLNNSWTYPLNFYYTSASTPVDLSCRDCGGPLMLARNNEVVGIHNSGCGQVPKNKKSPETTRHISLDYYKYFIGDVIKD